jgi:hypothetical protein
VCLTTNRCPVVGCRASCVGKSIERAGRVRHGSREPGQARGTTSIKLKRCVTRPATAATHSVMTLVVMARLQVPIIQQKCLDAVGAVEEAMVDGFPFIVPEEYSNLPQLKVVPIPMYFIPFSYPHPLFPPPRKAPDVLCHASARDGPLFRWTSSSIKLRTHCQGTPPSSPPHASPYTLESLLQRSSSW